MTPPLSNTDLAAADPIANTCETCGAPPYTHCDCADATPVDEVLSLRAENTALRSRLAAAERVIAEQLPHRNGPNDTTPGDPDAWDAAMFNLGEMREQRDEALVKCGQMRAERDTLSERLAAAEREVARLQSVCQDYRNQRGVAWSEGDEQRNRADCADGYSDFLEAERDEARAKLEQVAKERDEWAAVAAYVPTPEVERIERETTEAIAAFVDGWAKPSSIVELSTKPLAADIRNGAWRDKREVGK